MAVLIGMSINLEYNQSDWQNFNVDVYKVDYMIVYLILCITVSSALAPVAQEVEQVVNPKLPLKHISVGEWLSE